MSRQPIIPIISLLLRPFTMCEKRKQQYSYWQAKKENCSTNDVFPGQKKAGTDCPTNSDYAAIAKRPLGFGFTFNDGISAYSGSLIPDDSLQDTSRVCLNMLHNDTTYYARSDITLFVSIKQLMNPKRYSLDLIWFYNA